MRTISRIVLGLCLLATPALAQPLADRVPEDAILYVGWCGAEALPPGFADSHLKAVVDASRVRELFTQFLPQAVEMLARKEPDSRAPLEIARVMGRSLWKHPTAIHFSGLHEAPNGRTIPKIALICKAGNDALALRTQIDAALSHTPASLPVHSFMVDDFVIVASGYEQGAQALAAGAALAQSPAFQGALKQVHPEPVFVAYADMERAAALVESLAASNEQAAQIVPRVIDALGLRGLKRAITTSGFDGKDWMSQTFIEAPAPRTGLLQLLDSEPVSKDLLNAVPADATFFATARFDPAKAINQIRATASEINPKGGQFIDMAIGAVQMAIAKNPVTDILEPLGQDWAVYCSPSVAGNGVLGLVVVNKLDDPTRAAGALPIASVNLSNWVSIAMQRAQAPVQISGRMTKIDGLNVYYIGAPILAPAWTLKDGYLHLALYPQAAASGARFTGRRADAKDITSNEKFIALRKRLGVENPRTISFYDLETTAAHGSTYQQLLVLGRYAGISDLFGLPLPEPLLPPLDVLQAHLGPAGSVSWVDDAGLHSKSISPFPGSRMFSEPGMISGAALPGTAMGMSILLPSLNRARETANRVKCASNMRQMGQAILLYSNENQGRFPPSLGELLRTQEITTDVFICPSGANELPPQVMAGGIDAMVKWVDEDSDYVYLGANMNNQVPADRIVVYEKAHNHDGEGINMLFGDGHVEFNMMPHAKRMIAEQQRN